MTASFDVRFEPWIPVRDSDGVLRKVGLRDALVQAPTIAALAVSDPIDEPALLRLLLAMVHHIIDGPRTERDWVALWEQGSLDAELVDHYLDDRSDGRFDLFDDVHPFLQAPVEGAVRPAVEIHKRFVSGTAELFFEHTDTYRDVDAVAFPADEMALYLVTAHAYQTIYRGVQPGTLLKGMVLFNVGANLFETLLLNLVRYDPAGEFPMPGSDDRPAWDREAPVAGRVRPPEGYLDYLTWQPRRVQLIPAQVDGRIVVSRIRVERGEQFDDAFKARYPRWDPMLPAEVDDDGNAKKIWLPFERVAWRETRRLLSPATQLHAKTRYVRPGVVDHREALALRYDIPLPRDLLAVSTGTPQNPGSLYWWRKDTIPVPPQILGHPQRSTTVRVALERTEDAYRTLVRNLGQVLDTLAVDGGRQRIRADAEATFRSYLLDFWDRLGSRFEGLLDGVIADDPDAADRWLEELQTVTMDVYDAATRPYLTAAIALEDVFRHRRFLAAHFRRPDRRGS